MTPQEKRRFKRHRKQRLWNIVHTVILFCLTVTMILVLGNLYALTVMQNDTLNTLNDINIELDKQSIDQAEKVVKIEDYSPTNTYSSDLTPQELDIVCRVVMSEARGEGLQGQMAVAQVIRDRSTIWEMTITEVVTAPSQFAKPYQGEITDEVRLAVANVFNGMSVLEEPVTHFHSGAEPYWTSNKVSRGIIGNHRFYY